MDDLSRIERIYGSVAEYNRSMEEDREYELEREMERVYKQNERCKANDKKLKDNEDIAVFYSYDCSECEHYEDVGPTFWDEVWMIIDDVEHGLCHNCNRKECPVWKEQKEARGE